jgi:flagellar FliJ protein
MPRFTFKLQGVLEQRKQVEMQRQRDVATAQQSMLNFQAELDALSALTRSSAAQLRSARLTAAQLAAHQRFAISTRHKSASLTRQLAEAHRDVAHAQAALTEAAKQRKMMEKLREREHAKWVEHQRKLDAAENEETTRQIQHAARVAQFDARI